MAGERRACLHAFEELWREDLESVGDGVGDLCDAKTATVSIESDESELTLTSRRG